MSAVGAFGATVRARGSGDGVASLSRSARSGEWSRGGPAVPTDTAESRAEGRLSGLERLSRVLSSTSPLLSFDLYDTPEQITPISITHLAASVTQRYPG